MDQGLRAGDRQGQEDSSWIQEVAATRAKNAPPECLTHETGSKVQACLCFPSLDKEQQHQGLRSQEHGPDRSPCFLPREAEAPADRLATRSHEKQSHVL
jgi:hypothetical protein